MENKGCFSFIFWLDLKLWMWGDVTLIVLMLCGKSGVVIEKFEALPSLPSTQRKLHRQILEGVGILMASRSFALEGEDWRENDTWTFLSSDLNDCPRYDRTFWSLMPKLSLSPSGSQLYCLESRRNNLIHTPSFSIRASQSSRPIYSCHQEGKHEQKRSFHARRPITQPARPAN